MAMGVVPDAADAACTCSAREMRASATLHHVVDSLCDGLDKDVTSADFVNVNAPGHELWLPSTSSFSTNEPRVTPCAKQLHL